MAHVPPIKPSTFRWSAMHWLRWHHGACSDSKWPLIARKSGENVGAVVALWAALLEHASQSEERGDVSRFDPEETDALYGWPDGTSARVLRAMLEKKLIVDGRIRSWEKRQPLREDPTAAERKRRQRAREASMRNVEHPEVAALSRPVTHGHAPEKIRTEKKKEYIPHRPRPLRRAPASCRLAAGKKPPFRYRPTAHRRVSPLRCPGKRRFPPI